MLWLIRALGKHRIIRCCRFRIKVNQWFRTPWGAFSAFFSVSLVLLVFVVVNMALFATAPKSDDFWWSDAPRHALNGAFIKDLITAAPWHDLRQWAIAYYLKYPALTILFY